jgi:hypothetical protein
MIFQKLSLEYIKDIGRMTINMVKESKPFLMGHCIKVIYFIYSGFYVNGKP